jgi:RNA polymerase sigma-70 factor (ECF subfamily)
VPNTIKNRIIHDDELILRLQRGDQWTFQLLVRRFGKRIFSIAFGLTLDVEESRAIVQDVFLEVYRSVGEYRGDASLATWLQRITVKRCFNWKRRWIKRFTWFYGSGKRADITADGRSGDRSAADGPVAGDPSLQAIDTALRTLPPQARAIFALRVLEGLSYKAIAEVTGIRPELVRSDLFQCTQAAHGDPEIAGKGREATDPQSTACDGTFPDRYLAGELVAGERTQLKAHLADCAACRRQMAAIQAFFKGFREWVRQGSDAVDFAVLEKSVLTDVLYQHRRPGRAVKFMGALRYVIPIVVAAGLLVLFANSNFIFEKAAPPPSAIIDAFSGPVSSVLIYEVPETGQTILWFQETPDVQGEQHAD